MSLYSFLTDLRRQVANILLPEHGGTGSTYGEERVVVKAINSTGSNIRLYSVVEPTFGANDLRITPVTTAHSMKVMGSVVGYYGGEGMLIEDDAPDGYEVAVQTAGVGRTLIQSNVTRGQYAFTSTTAGKITSDTSGSGAFGLVLDTAWLTQTSNTRVFFSSRGGIAPGGVEVGWIQDVDESGTSFTNWSGVVGTWSSDGTVIKQTDSTLSQRIAKYTVLVPVGLMRMYEAEVRFDDASAFAAIYLFDGTNSNNGMQLGFDDTLDKAQLNPPSGTILVSLTGTALSTGNWYTARMIMTGDQFVAYVDRGSGRELMGTGRLTTQTFQVNTLGLIAWKKCSFRNIKSWYIGLPS